MTARSYLYVPGDQPAKLDKAIASEADALIADLEDGVAPSAKDAARTVLADRLAAPIDREIWVRIGSVFEDDLAIAALPGATGIYLPKIASASEVAALPGTKPVVPLIETAAALLDLPAIAASPRVHHLAIGEADLSADLGIPPDSPGWLAIRMQVVVASAAAGIEPPTAPVSPDFRDLDAFRASTVALARLGFGSRSAIHPAQVPIVNEVFTPTADEVDAARRVVDLYDASVRSGSGVTVDERGRMIDEAVVRAARRMLAAGRPGELHHP